MCIISIFQEEVNCMSISREMVKELLIRFATELGETYDEKSKCFMISHEEIMEDFEDFLDRLEGRDRFS